MRKVFLVSILLSLVVSLFASTIYKSNGLGQKLKLESSIGQEDYYLEVSNNAQTLYYNGSIYCVITTDVSKNQKIVTKNYSSGEHETYKYENGLLQSYSTDNSSITYNYIDSKLSFCIVDESEIFFLRSANDGTLIAIKRGSNIDLVGDTYLYENGAFYNIVSNSLVFTGSYDVQDDGSFTFNEGEKTYYYSSSGHLLSVVSDSETITYEYEDDVLSAVKTTKLDGTYSVEHYENGIIVTVNEYCASGVITTSIDYSTGKMIRTVYKDGRAVADIYYKDDNVTVDNIKYR